MLICTLALFKAGTFVIGLSVAGLDGDGCRAWSDMWVSVGYSVRREHHKPGKD